MKTRICRAAKELEVTLPDPHVCGTHETGSKEENVSSRHRFAMGRANVLRDRGGKSSHTNDCGP